MRRIFSIFVASSLLFTTFSNLAKADILMEWDKRPLRILLNIHNERIVNFGTDVQVGLPMNLSHLLRVQSTGGALYFKANAPFEPTRIQVRELATGRIILLDVVARDQGEDYEYEPITVVSKDVASNQNAQLVETATKQDIQRQSMPMPADTRSSLPIPASLIRYAAQSLYAPVRAIEPLEGVSRVAMKLPSSLPNLIPNLPLEITPLESWGLGEFVVTAFKLKNRSYDNFVLSPKFLQGNYYAVAFQHHTLERKGLAEDTTVVYVVTRGKFTPEMMY